MNNQTKKWVIIILAVVLAVIMTVAAILLAVCLPKLKVIGSWDSVWCYNDNMIEAELVLKLNGRYTEVIIKNGVALPEESGKYKVVDGKVRCYDPHTDKTYYEYTVTENGFLENGGHLYARK